MNAEKTRAWSIPVLLTIIAALVAVLGTTSVRTLDRVEAAVTTLRTELTADLRSLAGQVRVERDTNIRQDAELSAVREPRKRVPAWTP